MSNEKWLIDASKLLKKYNLDCNTAQEMYIALINAPTVDAVEVVRCKDCKKWDKTVGSCGEFTSHRFPAGGRIAFLTRENDFCSYGEK